MRRSTQFFVALAQYLSVVSAYGLCVGIAAGVVPGVSVELELSLERYFATAARTFADARPGDIILYEDSYGNVAIAISGGSAARLFGVNAADDVRIHLRTP